MSYNDKKTQNQNQTLFWELADFCSQCEVIVQETAV